MTASLLKADGADLAVVDEASYAEWQRELGIRVVERRGRHWVEPATGCFQPVHALARLRRSEIGRPSWLCVTFRACLGEADSACANCFVPAVALPSPKGYEIRRLSAQRQALVRRCLRRVEIVAPCAPDILIDQGFRFVEEAHRHNSVVPLPSRGAFRRMVESCFRPRRGLVLAALLRDGNMVGFTVNHAVDQTACADRGWVSAEGNRLDVWPAGPVALLPRCRPALSRRSEIMNGLHPRERAGVSDFKRRLGFGVAPVPRSLGSRPQPRQAPPLDRGGVSGPWHPREQTR